FRRAVAAGPGSPERELFWFREGKNGGSEPPTNWRSVFGGPAWSRVRDLPFAAGTPAAEEDLYYLHLFDRSQPDLNWHNPAVRAEFLETLRFWLDRGAD
ncbi:alpha-amylase family glycosyl hydrolase, partial [Escherichia coli]|nr:alpha-amylase family glycosyl hydrolase [Escherichia coli]